MHLPEYPPPRRKTQSTSLFARGSRFLLPSTAGAGLRPGGSHTWAAPAAPLRVRERSSGTAHGRAPRGSRGGRERGSTPPAKPAEHQASSADACAEAVARSAGCRPLRSCPGSFHATAARLQVQGSSSLFCTRAGACCPRSLQVLSGPRAENCWKIPGCLALLKNPNFGATEGTKAPPGPARDESRKRGALQPLGERPEGGVLLYDIG